MIEPTIVQHEYVFKLPHGDEPLGDQMTVWQTIDKTRGTVSVKVSLGFVSYTLEEVSELIGILKAAHELGVRLARE